MRERGYIRAWESIYNGDKPEHNSLALCLLLLGEGCDGAPETVQTGSRHNATQNVLR